MRSLGRIVGLGWAATGLLLAVACSSFGSGDSPTVVEAGTEASADTGADEGTAPVDTLSADDFESDNGACGKWEGFGVSSLERVADAGTDGSFACKVCSTVATGSYFGLETALEEGSGPPKAGYFLEANMRVESGEAAVRAAFVVDGVFKPGIDTAEPGWQHVSHRVSADAGAAVRARASARMVKGPACVVVDDIVVRRVE